MSFLIEQDFEKIRIRSKYWLFYGDSIVPRRRYFRSNILLNPEAWKDSQNPPLSDEAPCELIPGEQIIIIDNCAVVFLINIVIRYCSG